MHLKSVGGNKLSEFATAREALADLCEPFARGVSIRADCTEVQPAAMLPAERQLLAHREHMTIVLQDHHGLPVEVHVQEAVRDEDLYARKIILTPGHASKIASPNQRQAASKIRETLASYQQSEDLINLGAYASGSNPKIDQAIRLRPQIIDFLKQDAEHTESLERTLAQLEELAAQT